MANEQDKKQLSWGAPQHGQQKQSVQSGTNVQHQNQPKPAVSNTPASGGAPEGGRSAARVVGWLAVGVVAGVIIAWGATGTLTKKGTDATTAGSLESATSTDSTQEQATSATFTAASPQKAGTQVAVSGVNVTAPTWVVVYESRDGKPGNVLGASLFFPGTSSGQVELLRTTTAGQTYFVTERKDDGDHQFSLKNDNLVLGTDGQPMWVTFSAN